MNKKNRAFLFLFDLVGISPQLLIFKNYNYKTTLSSSTSIIILFFSTAFIIYSLTEYLKFDNPSIVYSKGNDEKTKRALYMKNILLMFQCNEVSTMETINSSIVYFEGEFVESYTNGTILKIPLDIGKCEMGKNIDKEFSDLIRKKSEFEKTEKDFYCINSKNDNNSLFYIPNVGSSYINLYLTMKNNSKYTPDKIQSLIVSENDLIVHNDNKAPIKKNYMYFFTEGFKSNEFTTINYDFQYIKYESDEGLIFKNPKVFTGTSYSDINFYRNIQVDNNNLSNNLNELNIGKISVGLSKTYFDNYKRSYKKLQSLLAEIMSVVNLLFSIGSQLVKVLCNKKMSSDIIRSLFNKSKRQIKKYNFNKAFIDFEKSEIFVSERKSTSLEFDNRVNTTSYMKKNDEINNLKNSSTFSKKEIMMDNNTAETNCKILTKIKYYHILKSFLCCKDSKTKLLNLCHNIIREDLCIENMLEKIYELKNFSNLFLERCSDDDKEKLNIIHNDRLKEINKYICYIKKKNNQDTTEINSKETINQK